MRPHGDHSLASTADEGVLRARVERATGSVGSALYDAHDAIPAQGLQRYVRDAAEPQIAAKIDRAKLGQQVDTALVIYIPARAK